MKLIHLTQEQVALVDDDDFDRVNSHKWQASFNPKSRTYTAVRPILVNGKQTSIAMHREIMSAPQGKQVDHINHDTLDNRKENLRICSARQNQGNVNISPKNTSGFKGVIWHRRNKKWHARISIKGRMKHIGYYETASEAAMAYDFSAIAQWGEFALTNEKLGLFAWEK